MEGSSIAARGGGINNRNMYRQHIEQLATRHKISFAYADFNEYDTETELATITAPTNELTYFEALHELGHAFYKHKPTSNAQVIAYEHEAWEWALYNSILKPSRQATERVRTCLEAVEGLYR